MGNYTTFEIFENPRRDRQARNFVTNDPKILDLKSSSNRYFPNIDVGCPCDKNSIRIHIVPRCSRSTESSSTKSWPGARFSKVPIINGPGMLSPFALKIEGSIVLHLT